MRVRSVFSLLLLLMGLGSAALAMDQRDRDDCVRARGDRAIAACTRLIADRSVGASNRAKAHYNRGVAYAYGKPDYDRALNDFTAAIRLDAKYARAFAGLCHVRIAIGQTDQARKDCDDALRLAPKNNIQAYSDIFETRGHLYLKLGQFDQAIAEYDAALKLESDLAESLYGRGLAKRQKGDAAGGEADLAAARKIKATVAEDLARLGLK